MTSYSFTHHHMSYRSRIQRRLADWFMGGLSPATIVGSISEEISHSPNLVGNTYGTTSTTGERRLVETWTEAPSRAAPSAALLAVGPSSGDGVSP